MEELERGEPEELERGFVGGLGGGLEPELEPELESGLDFDEDPVNWWRGPSNDKLKFSSKSGKLPLCTTSSPPFSSPPFFPPFSSPPFFPPLSSPFFPPLSSPPFFPPFSLRTPSSFPREITP